ncbi:15276_t:CDS:2, partial [Racocetra persica]
MAPIAMVMNGKWIAKLLQHKISRELGSNKFLTTYILPIKIYTIPKKDTLHEKPYLIYLTVYDFIRTFERFIVEHLKLRETVTEQSKNLEATVWLIEASHCKKLHELKTTFE